MDEERGVDGSMAGHGSGSHGLGVPLEVGHVVVSTESLTTTSYARIGMKAVRLATTKGNSKK